jgi:hypothetical protein
MINPFDQLVRHGPVQGDMLLNQTIAQLPVRRLANDTRYQVPTMPTGFGEAPFLCRSIRWPDRVVTDPEDFARRRVERVQGRAPGHILKVNRWGSN